MDILILQGHPDPTERHYGHALAEAYAAGARASHHVVETIEIARLEFPFVRSRLDLGQGPVPKSIQSAQAALLRAHHIVLIYPIWNGGSPALLRAFFEQTLRSTFTCPDAPAGARLGFSSYFTQHKALAGKSARIITTMQMPAWLYRWYFHPHSEKNALKVAGMSPVRETLIGWVESPDARRRARWLEKVQKLGRAGL